MMNNEVAKNAWDNLKAGYYSNSLALYDQLVEMEQEPIHFRNRSLVYLNLGNYNSAKRDINKAIELTPKEYQVSSDYKRIGICHWYLGEVDRALINWETSTKTPYTDAGGGVLSFGLLIYAYQRMQKRGPINRVLKKIRKIKTEKTEWPGLLIKFFLDQSTEYEVLYKLNTIEQVILRDRYFCQFEFYQGVKNLIEGNSKNFSEHMLQSSGFKNAILESEYYLANWEILRDFPERVTKNNTT